jgi:hypothetical protein
LHRHIRCRLVVRAQSNNVVGKYAVALASQDVAKCSTTSGRILDAVPIDPHADTYRRSVVEAAAAGN